jgi:DNA helicase-2/ATP-dependent DNA helicase PcrA
MSRTTILFGPPGCGKTTSLLDIAESTLRQGVDPSRIGFFAFTRKAAHEAMSRATARFNLTDDDLIWFKTLHSAAFKLLNLQSNEVMSTHHYKDLGRALGSFTFEHDYGELTERPPQGGGLGDRALAIYALARTRTIGIEEQWRLADDPWISLIDAKRFAAAIAEYKRSYSLLDFTDFLDHPAHKPIDLDIMILDEAQDLTAQQWQFARTIGAKARTVVIAGDDDQGIYQWSGADLRTFLSIKGALRVLPKSYRLPHTVWQCANDIAARIRIRKAKEWQPKDAVAGTIHHLAYADQVPLKQAGTWLLLARHQYQLDQLRCICRDQGVVYQHEGMWSNQTPSVRAVVCYERLRRGDPITGAQADLVARFISGMTPPRSVAPRVWADLAFPFNIGRDRPDWMDALSAIGSDEREYIRRLRREGESLSKEGRIVISTIHGCKGGEADNVLLLPDISKRVMGNMQRDRDQELRVWYVGVSRARENLYLIKPRTGRFMELT